MMGLREATRAGWIDDGSGRRAECVPVERVQRADAGWQDRREPESVSRFEGCIAAAAGCAVALRSGGTRASMIHCGGWWRGAGWAGDGSPAGWLAALAVGCSSLRSRVPGARFARAEGPTGVWRSLGSRQVAGGGWPVHADPRCGVWLSARCADGARRGCGVWPAGKPNSTRPNPSGFPAEV